VKKVVMINKRLIPIHEEIHMFKSLSTHTVYILVEGSLRYLLRMPRDWYILQRHDSVMTSASL
jgi:hypothetical protein